MVPETPDDLRSFWALKLKPFAQDLSVRYGAQVVLLGGALREAQPRDVDVRALMLDESRFVQRFGKTIDEWRIDRGRPWLREVDKMTRRLETYLLHGMGADFSIWPITVFQEAVPHLVLAEGWVDPYPVPAKQALLDECRARAIALRASRATNGLAARMSSEATFFESLASALVDGTTL